MPHHHQPHPNQEEPVVPVEAEEILLTPEPDLAEEYKGRWQRAVADMENIRRRSELDRVALRQAATENIVSELLPVVDNFFRATEHVPADQKESPWLTGIMHIQKQLTDVLEAQGVTEVLAKDGDEFDPMQHEAISHEVNAELDNKIKVLSKGYALNGRLLRPVRVTVYTTSAN